MPDSSEFAGSGEQEHDATLGEFLMDLVRGAASVSDQGAVETAAKWLPTSRFSRLEGSIWDQPPRLSANLASLASQLELALLDARQKIGAAVNAA